MNDDDLDHEKMEAWARSWMNKQQEDEALATALNLAEDYFVTKQEIESVQRSVLTIKLMLVFVIIVLMILLVRG